MKLLGFLHLKGIGGQIAGLVVASIVTLHLIIAMSLLLIRPDIAETPPRGEHQLVDAALLLGRTGVDERPRLLVDIARAFPELEIAVLPPGAAVASDNTKRRYLHFVRRHLGPDYNAVMLALDGGSQRVGITLPDGTMIAAQIEESARPPWLLGGPWMMTLLFAVVSVTLLGLWAARALTAPLSSFAHAAESFSLDGTAEPLPERGPEEIRFLARALNRMQQRISNLMADRTKMLAAISHDLRTPITRLRLRAEFIEDETHRRRTLVDLDQMRGMLESVLSLLRNDRNVEAVTLVDVASTLQLIADQFCDMDYTVRYEGPTQATMAARPDGLHRGITNLVENAVRFGTEVTIRLDVSDRLLTIHVEDDGPGISDARKAEMLEPFVRGDDARNMDNSIGFGLGLSIAHAVVLAHDGELSLHDRVPHGLIVRIQLPMSRSNRKATLGLRAVDARVDD